jgi:orotidine 5'-phosphate decarboxylase subfamily 2
MHQHLLSKIQRLKHPMCIGFDPDVSDLHPFLKLQMNTLPIESFLVRWYQAIIEPISLKSHSIKLQSAFFEQFGPLGFSALQDIVRDGQRKGIHVILDAKRGDISTTMAAYGQTAFETIQANSLTILPWMGVDSMRALIPWMKQGKGVYIVWLSSNESGRVIQTERLLSQKTIAEYVFEQFYELAESEGVLDQLGWVLGATDIPPLVYELKSKSSLAFLLPGMGAQGATFTPDIAKLRHHHPASLFPVSRGLIKPTIDVSLKHWDDYSKFVEQKWDAWISQSKINC